MFCIHMANKKLLKDITGYADYDHAEYKKLFNFLLENGIVILLPEITAESATPTHRTMSSTSPAL